MANTLTFANQTITDANLFGGISYIIDLNDGDEFSIGNTASASVEFITDIQLPLYSKDSVNGTFTWSKDSVSRGRYYITEVKKEDSKYTVTAYDAMILLETSIASLNLSFPVSVTSVASQIATFMGCTVSGTVNNGTLTVSALEEMPIRRLLGYVAEASGCSVKVDGSDHLCFVYYADSQTTITANDYKKINVADYTCSAIDKVTIFDSYGNMKAEAGTGTNTLYIQGNPFLDEATTTAAQTILSVVSGFVYRPMTVELFTDDGIEAGTIVTFGTTPTLVMHLESSEDGAVAESVGSDNRAEYNKSIDIVANEARVLAEAALETAEHTDQYFWMASTGSDTGVHITEVPREDFIADPQNGGGNIVARSNGIAVRDGLTELATFGASGATIGISTGAHTVIDEDGMQIYSVDQNDNLVELANIGYGQGQSASGTAVAPHYTFGTRASGSAIGNYSVAEGRNTTASGYASHSEGIGTIASGRYSHAEGYNTTASGDYSHAEGYGTTTPNDGAFVIGSYNSNTYLVGGNKCFVIGNGSSNDYRNNILEVADDGSIRGVAEFDEATITASTGTLVDMDVRRFGQVVQLTMLFRNTSAVASGSNVFVGTLRNLQPAITVTGSAYYGEHALSGRIVNGTITIRNTSPTSVTIGSGNSATMSFTYIVEGLSEI